MRIYPERFIDNNGEKVLVVYDCRTTKKAEEERLKEEIRKLPQGKDVDSLFIFYFDKDHVYGYQGLDARNKD